MDYEIPPHEIPESYEQRPPFSADWLYTPVFLSSGKELWILEFLIIANDRPIIDSERACSRGAGPNPFHWETTSCSIASLRRPPRGVVDFCMSENSGRTGWLEHHFILSGRRPRVDEHDLFVSVGGRKDIPNESSDLCWLVGTRRRM